MWGIGFSAAATSAIAAAMPFHRHDIAGEARRLLALAWPVILTSLNWTVLQLIDVAFVGHAGTEELSALAAARTLTFVVIVAGLGAVSGVLVFTARDDGAGHVAGTADRWRGGILAALLLGLAGMAVLMLTGLPAMQALGVPPAMAGRGAAVVDAMAIGFPGLLIMASTGYFLEGISRPARVTAVNLLTLPANAVLAWLLVGGHGGFAAHGAVGGAMATSLVNLGGAGLLLLSVWLLPDARARGVRDIGVTAWRRAAGDLPGLLRFGVVPAFAAGFELAGFSWLIALSTRLGAVTAAAYQTVFSLHNLLFGIALGFASAAGVRVGNALGAQERGQALPRTMIAVALAVVVMGAGGGLMALFPDRAVAPFSGDPAVLRMAAGMLAMLGPFMLFDGVQLICLYALRSMGDQIAGGANSILAYFIVTGGSGWYLVTHGWAGTGLIIATAAGMVAAAALQGGRLVWISSRLVR
jgi:MATE family multidrug resistance protein